MIWGGQVKIKVLQIIKLENKGRKEEIIDSVDENWGSLRVAVLAMWRLRIAVSPALTRSPHDCDHRIEGGIEDDGQINASSPFCTRDKDRAESECKEDRGARNSWRASSQSPGA